MTSTNRSPINLQIVPLPENMQKVETYSSDECAGVHLPIPSDRLVCSYKDQSSLDRVKEIFWKEEKQ